MIIQNKSKHTILSHHAIEAKTVLQKTVGLISHKKPATMIFRTRFGMHTFFMNYPIDILILDKNNHVVALRKNLKPNRIFLWNPKYDCVIEFPERTLSKNNTQIQDIIHFLV